MVLLVCVTRNIGASCLPFTMVTHAISSNIGAFGRGAGVIAGWRLSEIDAFVLDMQLF